MSDSRQLEQSPWSALTTTHAALGHARLLVSALMRNIVTRGETPFLHIFSDNAAAAALYRKLGFTYQRSLTVTVLKRPDQGVVRSR